MSYLLKEVKVVRQNALDQLKTKRPTDAAKIQETGLLRVGEETQVLKQQIRVKGAWSQLLFIVLRKIHLILSLALCFRLRLTRCHSKKRVKNEERTHVKSPLLCVFDATWSGRIWAVTLARYLTFAGQYPRRQLFQRCR